MDGHPPLIRGASLRPTPWRNGMGVTRDVMSVHGPDGALRWQVGIADLVGDGPFSDYAGYDRVFTPMSGDIALSFDDGPYEPCPPLVPFPFAGERATLCRVAAPGQAFNVVVDRRYHRGEAAVVRLEAGGTLPPAPGTTLLHVVAGALATAAGCALAGDTAVDAGPCTAVEPTIVIRARID